MTFLGTIQSMGSNTLKRVGSTVCSLPRLAKISFGLSATSFLTGASTHFYSSRKVAEYQTDSSGASGAWKASLSAMEKYNSNSKKTIGLKARYTFMESPWRAANICYTVSALSFVVGAGSVLNAWRTTKPAKVVKPAPAPKPAAKPALKPKPAPKLLVRPKPTTTKQIKVAAAV